MDENRERGAQVLTDGVGGSRDTRVGIPTSKGRYKQNEVEEVY